MPNRAALALLLIAPTLVVTACGSSSTAESSSASPTVVATPLSSAGGAASASPPAAGAASPSPELVAWAGQVCDQAASLRTSVTDLGTAVAAGGSDIGASLQKQFDTISASATSLATTAQTLPPGATSSPEATAVQDAAARTRQSIDALGQSITELRAASGVGVVTALAAVGSATTTAVQAVGDTATAVGTAVSDGSSELGQAFRANPSCRSLTS